MSETLDAIRAVDSHNQLDDVLALPDHLSDALFRVESARIASTQSDGLVVCGMGGSAIGADLARAALGSRTTLPFTTVRDYGLEPWTSPERTVLCASYSGNTEETLAAFEAASAVGARRVVATTGGALGDAAREADVPIIPIPASLQPRAAVGYMFVAAAEVAACAGAAPVIRTEIDGAVEHLRASRESLIERAGVIADVVGGSFPVIYGADLTTAVAYRWKTQINENAKIPAFSHALPEMDHNELVGWEEGGGGERFSAIFLDDPDQHPRARQRFELTANLIEHSAAGLVHIEAEGDTRTARMLWSVMLGDLVSLLIAVKRGIDPSPVPVIERLKEELGKL